MTDGNGPRIVGVPGMSESEFREALAACFGSAPADCSGCRCCPAGACEPDEPLGPGVCGYTCPCHPDFYREEANR